MRSVILIEKLDKLKFDISGIRSFLAGCSEYSLVGNDTNLNIPDSSYTASTYHKWRHAPYQAKLYGPYGWAAQDNTNPADYLQIDLGSPRVITAVATQGSGYYDVWVETYKIQYTDSLESWTTYTDSHAGPKVKFKAHSCITVSDT